MDEQVRERVVDVADALFYGRGIQSVAVDEIRTAADVSLKRLYAEFPGKEDIVLAVLDRRHAMWEAGLFDAATGLTAPRARLLAVFDFLEDWFEDERFRGCGFINAFGELGAVSPRVADAVREHKRSVRLHLGALVAQLGAPAVLADQLLLLAEGAQTTAAIEGGSDAARHARAAAITLIDAASAQ